MGSRRAGRLPLADRFLDGHERERDRLVVSVWDTVIVICNIATILLVLAGVVHWVWHMSWMARMDEQERQEERDHERAMRRRR